jgi:outer membrane protein assembly factor BamB
MSMLALLMSSGLAVAGDWPQWLGPNRDSGSPEKIAPWKTPPKVSWHVPVGEGHSSPVVTGGRVYLHVKVKDKDEEELLAFDARTGKEAWRTAYERGAFASLFGVGPRATPAVADGRIYSYGVTGYLSCFDTDKGKRLWQVEVLKDFQASNLLFGASCSPIVLGKRVLVNAGAKGASIAAFDVMTGKVAWISQDDSASYSSPIRIEQGKSEVVVFLTGKRLLGLDPTDGSLYWEFPLADSLFESSTTPVRVGDTLIGSSITYGSAGLSLETKDGKPAVKQAWKNPRLTCYFSTPVAVGKDNVYMVTGAIPTPFSKTAPEATLRCIQAATGKVLWSKPKVGEYHASLLRTGNDKLLLLDDAGNLMLLEPDAKEYRESCRSKVCGKTWAHPALSDGRLYIRDEKELICLEFTE